jgi:hypothetical protein
MRYLLCFALCFALVGVAEARRPSSRVPSRPVKRSPVKTPKRQRVVSMRTMAPGANNIDPPRRESGEPEPDAPSPPSEDAPRREAPRGEATRPDAPKADAPKADAPDLKPGPRLVEVKKRRLDVMAGGLVLLGAAWAGNVGFAYGFNAPNSYYSLIPFAGPILQMQEQYGQASEDPGVIAYNQQLQTAVTVGLALDLTAQVAGLVMVIAGAASKRVDKRIVIKSGDVTVKPGGPKVSLVPHGVAIKF